jgi:hypothetical protein
MSAAAGIQRRYVHRLKAITRRLRVPTGNSGSWATENGEYSRMSVQNLVKICRAAPTKNKAQSSFILLEYTNYF